MKRALMFASVASMIDQFNLENIKILQELNYKVDVACNFEFGSTTSQNQVNDMREKLENNGVRTYHIPVPRKTFLIKDMIEAYKQTERLVQKNQYDIVHCHSPIGGVIARLACKKYRIRGTKVIYTAHGFHFYKGAPLRNWLIYYPIEKWFSRYTDCLITINREDYNISINKRFKAKDIKHVKGVGVDFSKYFPIKKQLKNELRLKHGFNKDDFILIYPAELNKNKNQFLLIEVVNLLKEKIPNIKLILAGEGNLVAAYKEIVEKEKLNQEIVFTGFRKDIDELIKLSDLSVASSIREGLGLNVIEGMACGLPVVATKNRGHNELVNDGNNGYLIDLNNIESFAEKINLLYNNPEKMKYLGENSRELAEEFSISKISPEMCNIYK